MGKMLAASFHIILFNMIGYVKTEKLSVLSLNWTEFPMKYVDVAELGEVDATFDRMVVITLNIPNYKDTNFENRNIVPGVLIDSNRVLTAYNPFRSLIHSEEMKENTIVGVISGRKWRPKNVSEISYYDQLYHVECGRQIVYAHNSSLAPDLWFGQNSPLHDLMVLRIDENITNISNLKSSEYTFDKYYPNDKNVDVNIGVFITELATYEDKFGEEFKFASLGFRNDEEIYTFSRLHVASYQRDDEVIENCDEWLTRDMGYFICISNIDKFPALGSGAMLMSNDKLFGVGSFAYFRDKKSILVFTDVRPYNELIMNACTEDDTTLIEEESEEESKEEKIGEEKETKGTHSDL